MDMGDEPIKALPSYCPTLLLRRRCFIESRPFIRFIDPNRRHLIIQHSGAQQLRAATDAAPLILARIAQAVTHANTLPAL